MLATIDLHVHELCMRVAVRVLHSCAFILIWVFVVKHGFGVAINFANLLIWHVKLATWLFFVIS